MELTVREMARMGGKANVKKHGKKHMKELSKMALEVRWGKKKLEPSKKP